MKTEDIAWLAGLLEGEGTFRFYGATPGVRVAMTDKDIIERAAKLMGGNIGYEFGTKKLVWTTGIYGNQALSLLEQILPYMGQRRTAKIKDVMQQAADRPGKPKGSRVHSAKLREEDISILRQRLQAGVSQHQLSREYGVSVTAIWAIAREKTWTHV